MACFGSVEDNLLATTAESFSWETSSGVVWLSSQGPAGRLEQNISVGHLGPACKAWEMLPRPSEGML